MVWPFSRKQAKESKAEEIDYLNAPIAPRIETQVAVRLDDSSVHTAFSIIVYKLYLGLNE